MKKSRLFIVLSLVLLLILLAGCRNSKNTISGTYFADDKDGKTYIVYMDGKISADDTFGQTYEHLSGNKFILHLEKADVVAEYDRALDLIEYRYDGIKVHWYNNYTTAEKGRQERGFSSPTAITEPEVEEQTPINSLPEEEVEEPASAIETAEKEEEPAPTEEQVSESPEEKSGNQPEEKKDADAKTEEEKIAEEEKLKAEAEAKKKAEEEKVKAEQERVAQVKKDLIGTWKSENREITFLENDKSSIIVDGKATDYTYEVLSDFILFKDAKSETITFGYEFKDGDLLLTLGDVTLIYKRGEVKKSE